MSYKRTEGYKRTTVNPETRRAYCKNCGVECPNRRRLYCTDDCREDYSVRNFPSHARMRVWERDRGICALCHIDTDPRAEDDAFRKLHISYRWTSRHYWEMDHIVPVAEGGGQCGLDGLRTLCLPCHRKVTRKLNERLRVIGTAVRRLELRQRHPELNVPAPQLPLL